MIIAINTDYPAGCEHFIFESISRLAEKYPEHQFIYIFDKSFDKNLICSGNIKAVIIRYKTKSALFWPFWYNYMIPVILKKYNATVFVSANGVCSLRTKLPQCLILQDLVFLHSPEYYAKNYVRFYKKFTPLFLSKAKTLATLSQFSKTTIADKYKIDQQNINVIYPGTRKIFIPIDEKSKEKVKEKYTGGKEYFLFAGDINPRNNLMNLLKAFSVFKKMQKSNMHLLIAGTLGENYIQFTEDLRAYKFRNEVTVLTGLNVKELAVITASAYAFVYPVLFDCFPQQPLESMVCEVPVIISNLFTMQEVCADAVLYFRPDDYTDIADKMMLVFKDENKRNELIIAGKIQVKKYDWDKSANQLWQLITNAIQYKTT